MNEIRKRTQYLDAARGIGILLVCVGHAITNGEHESESTLVGLLEFIAQFHMPLFFFISGSLFQENYIEHPIQSSWKKWKAYYVPFVVYSMLFLIFHNVFVTLHIVSDAYSFKEYLYRFIMVCTAHIQPLGGAMWFLRSLMTVVILYIWIRFIVTRCIKSRAQEMMVFIVVLALAVFGVSGKCTATFKLDWSLSYLLFFYLGYLYKKYDINRWVNQYKQWVALGGLTINLLVAIYSRVGILGRNLGNYWIFVITGVTGTLMILAVAQMNIVEKSRLLNIAGQKSLDIMCLHFLCFKPVSFILIRIYGLEINKLVECPVLKNIGGLWWIAYTAAGVVLPILIRVLFDKCKNFVRNWKGRKKANVLLHPIRENSIFRFGISATDKSRPHTGG